MNNISLLAKWLKSENTSSRESVRIATITRQFLGWTPKRYRKTLTALRAKIDVLEAKLCRNDWSNVDYSGIPSKAGMLYAKAFHRHDETRYSSWQEKAKKGEVKINTSVLNPFDIVSKVLSGGMVDIGDRKYCQVKPLDAKTKKDLDLFWTNLPNYLDAKINKNILCICDTSGSMRGNPIAAAISLSLYTAERNSGVFKDCFITFSNEPEIQNVSGSDIYDKIESLSKTFWNSNTDLQKVFEKILSKALEAGIKQEGMPSEIILISDMEFDKAVVDNNFTNLEEVKNKYINAGYEMPNLTFWNVKASDQSPAKFDERGVRLISGYSPTIFKSLFKEGIETPFDLFLKTVDVERYSNVKI